MKRLGVFAILVIFSASQTLSPKTHSPTAANPVASELQPSPEMKRLFDVFVGQWIVAESFEVSASRKGKSRTGTASFRAGPGFSLIEDYRSNGSAGELRFLALVWWDPSAQVYRLLTCANNDGCHLRGTLKWEGSALVNSWEEQVNGKPATFKDSFVDISRSTFRLVSEGSADGKTIWHVTTKYVRRNRKGE